MCQLMCPTNYSCPSWPCNVVMVQQQVLTTCHALSSVLLDLSFAFVFLVEINGVSVVTEGTHGPPHGGIITVHLACIRIVM